MAPPGPLAAASEGRKLSSAFDQYRNIVDTDGRLKFADKAILHAHGVEFGNGKTFHIRLEDFDLHKELGRGNYGTVRKVFHTKSQVDMAMKVCCIGFFFLKWYFPPFLCPCCHMASPVFFAACQVKRLGGSGMV